MHRYTRACLYILDSGRSNEQCKGGMGGLAFDNGMAADVRINEEDGQTEYEGEVWPGMIFLLLFLLLLYIFSYVLSIIM